MSGAIKKVSVDLSAGEEGVTRKKGRRLSLKNRGVKKSEIMRKIREGLLEKRKVTKKVKSSAMKEPKNPVQSAIDFFESKEKKGGGLGGIIKSDASYEDSDQSSIGLRFPSVTTRTMPTKPLKSILKRREPAVTEVSAPVPAAAVSVAAVPVAPVSAEIQVENSRETPVVEYKPPRFITGGGERRKTRAERRAKRRSTRIERKRTYKLGKKGKKVSVMIYGNKTRKRLKDEHGSYKTEDTNKMRRALRHRCLLKAGSTAPPSLVREIYMQSRLVGDVLAGGKNVNDLNDYYGTTE